MIPDCEAIVVGFLAARSDVAAIAGDRVSDETPADLGSPWVKLRQLDASDQPNAPFDHLVNYLLQIDCYAGATGGSVESSLLARTVREALHDLPITDLADAVVSSVHISGPAQIPDTDLEPTRDRGVLTVTIYAHPKP